MNNIDRILLAYSGTDAESFVALGGTLEEVGAAVSLARLDLDLDRTTTPPTVRSVVDHFVRKLQAD